MHEWCTQNMKTLAPIGAAKSATEIFIGEKENEQVRGLISNICGCYFVTQYNSSLPSFVLNFRILSQVVAEKSLTEKKVYRQTDRQTLLQKRQKLYTPIYFVPGV